MKLKNLVISFFCALIVAASAAPAICADKAAADPGTGQAEAALPALERIDINHADAALLSTLPGIGPKTAEKITAYRESNGPFTSVDDLLNIKGIGPDKMEKIRPLVTVS